MFNSRSKGGFPPPFRFCLDPDQNPVVSVRRETILAAERQEKLRDILSCLARFGPPGRNFLPPPGSGWMMLVKTFWILAGSAAIYVVVLAGVFVFQRQLQYQPGHADPDPQSLGLTGVKRVEIIAPDGVRLVLWHAPPAPGNPTILFFHGNAGDLTDRAPRMAFYQGRGYGAAFLSYRGFGGSQGEITEAGLTLDARTAYDWLRGRGEAIVLVGESLGTGVAVQLAAQVPVAAVALDAPYSATVEVAQGRFPFLPVAALMKDQFRSNDHIAAIQAPLLTQHGQSDMVIPFRYGERLFAAAVEPKTMIALPGRGHEMIFEADTWARELDFFAGLPALAAPPATP
jgi:fermentation-respiration switch protein FrsA (DUF1100 family)